VVAIANLLWGKFRFRNSKKYDIPVSVLIPARNEENNISNLLGDLLQESYPRKEIIVFDDQSTDNTSKIVEEYAEVNLIRSAGLPAGWLGKNFACHSLSAMAKGKYFLFLDADVRISSGLINRVVAYAEKHKLGLFSLFPTQILLGTAEWLTVPLMNYILLSLLPLILVRKSGFPSLAAANGQFMLFNADVYRKYYPHEKFSGNPVEDIEIARFFKRKGIRVSCLAGDHMVQCRMYQNFTSAVNGFAKNIAAFFGNSIFTAVLFWLITSFGFLIILIFMPANFFWLYLAVIVSTRIIISITSGQHVGRNLFWLLPQQLSIGMVLFKAFKNKISRQYIWKERNIY